MSLTKLQGEKPLFCRANHSVNVSIPLDNTIWTPIPFDNNKQDTTAGAMHSPTVNNARFVAPVYGIYTGWIGLQANFTGRLTIGAFFNGDAVIIHQACNQAGVWNSIHMGEWIFRPGNFIEWRARAANSVATLVRASSHSLEATFRLVAAL